MLGLLLNSIVIDAQSVSGLLVVKKEILSVLLMWYCYLLKIPLLWLGLSQRIWQTYQNESNDEIVKRYLDENFFNEKEGFNLSVNTNYNEFSGISCYADRINYANILVV